MISDDSSRMPLDQSRRSDSNLIKITREIPLPFLIGMIIAFAGQAIALYYGQQEQAKQLSNQNADIRVLMSKVDSLADKRNDDMVKDIQRDNKVERQSERLLLIEDQLKKGR